MPILSIREIFHKVVKQIYSQYNENKTNNDFISYAHTYT